ncbi:hypothetical protein TUM20985_32600 [Mycobacterium antarcticum]|nr:hypothetical protein TUM20985_32600 [Mycolicibacterium sp. TUM20985]GLP83722.1 hypothetical protein TUM20984_51420 [Mycolicibacterium sp. TUM20984]
MGLLKDAGVSEDDLRHALLPTGRIPQIDEDDAAVVAPPCHPTRKCHRLTGVGGSQRTGGMTAQHENSLGMA